MGRVAFDSNVTAQSRFPFQLSPLVYPPFHPRGSDFHTHGGASEMGQSTRFGKDDAQNVTQRDNKRPKERSRDQVYKKRFSMESSTGIFGVLPPSLEGSEWPREPRLDR
jgi:hypothetical protein